MATGLRRALLSGGAAVGRRAGAPRRTFSASASAPLLPRWGSFGKTEEEVLELEAKVRAAGEAQVAVTREFAELTSRYLLRAALLFQPHKWFTKSAWSEVPAGLGDRLERYARVNDQLLDGCDYAYKAVLAEFCRDGADFRELIEANALSDEMATLLKESVSKYRDAGMRPSVTLQRVAGEPVCLFGSAPMSPRDDDGGFVATVLFRAREARGVVPRDAGASEGGAGGDAAAGGDEAAGGAEEGEYRETMQLWTFEAEQPPFAEYLNWIKAMLRGTDAEVPVRWRLRDINHTLHGFEQPEGVASAEEYVQQVASRALLIGLSACLLVYTLATTAWPSRRQPLMPRGAERGAGGAARGADQGGEFQ